MNDKYEFTGETKTVAGVVVRRVRRKCDGRLGGWVSDAANVKDFGGEFHDGVFLGGVFLGGVFHGGEFHGGVFHDGEFLGGVFHGGVFHDGVFHDGEFLGGVFHDGEFLGGVFLGGVFLGGVFLGGEFHGGVFYDGVFHDGVFRGGVFRGGEFRGGAPTASRSDGYLFVAIRDADGIVRISAGCHRFTFGEARDYWATRRAGTRLGDESLALVDHLERMATLAGWIDCHSIGTPQ